MYFETQIGKLSKVQLNNLLKGKNVRIKKGTSHSINLTESQVKKFHRNSRQGKALTIKLNQDQIAKQGSGILGDVIGMINPNAGTIAKSFGLGMKGKRGKGIVGDLVGMINPTAGMVAKAVGLGMKKRQGKGIVGDLVGMINPTAGMVAKAVGLGVKKKHGKGFLTDLAKDAAINLAKTVGKLAVNKGSEYLTNKIDGAGMRKRRKATPAQLAALARGRAIRDANRYGGALYVA